jgi:capsule polysaccharide export protein KpsE/RkpR
MFSRISKQALLGIRRFSNEAETQLETWIKINDRMHIEAAAKAESAVSGVKAELAFVKAELAFVKADVAALRSEVKTDISTLKADVNELRKGQIEIHKEMTSNTRLLLAGMFGTAALFFGANRYLDDRKQVIHKLS